MRATTPITTIRATHGREFIPHKMFATGTTMAAPAKNAYLVNKITFLQFLIFTLCIEGFGFNYAFLVQFAKIP